MTKAMQNLAPIDLRESVSLRDLAYAKLREAILDARLPTGSRINERTLASTLGVSTTPIKDALRRLETEGLVVTLPRRGTYVATLDPDDTHELVVLRSALEGTAARLAAERIRPGEATQFPSLLAQMEIGTVAGQTGMLVDLNEAFHHEIHRLSRSKRITRIVEPLRIHNRATRNRILGDKSEMRRALAEHTAIAERILAGDPDGAEDAMRRHVLRSAHLFEEMAPKSAVATT